MLNRRTSLISVFIFGTICTGIFGYHLKGSKETDNNFEHQTYLQRVKRQFGIDNNNFSAERRRGQVRPRPGGSFFQNTAGNNELIFSGNPNLSQRQGPNISGGGNAFGSTTFPPFFPTRNIVDNNNFNIFNNNDNNNNNNINAMNSNNLNNGNNASNQSGQLVFINNRPTIATMAPFTGRTTPSPGFLTCFNSCPTTSEYNPICGSDQELYFNEQKFNCAQRCGADIQIVRRGSCQGLFPMMRG